MTFGGRRICATARGRSTPPCPGAPADFVICQDMSCSRSSADFSARGPCFCCPYEIDRRLGSICRSAASWFYEESSSSSTSAHEYCWRFFSFLWSHLQPERYLLEKTPHNVHYINDIVRIFPQARLLAIHRDGRDVVVSARSFLKFYKRPPTWSFRESILIWRADMEAELRARTHSNLHVLSYEELIRNDRQTLRLILEYLDLPTTDDAVDDMIRRSSFYFHSDRQPGQENSDSFFRKGIVGDWRSQFGPEDKRTFKELAGDLLIQLGYESGYDW